MPDAPSPSDAVLSALGFALFTRDVDDKLRALTDPPAWLKHVWPSVNAAGAELVASDVSPFLENFLIDAEDCWRTGAEARAQSGPWVDQDEYGADVQLEATALTINAQPILLLEKLGEAFEARKAMLQKARETVIAYQRLNSEIQKKEILLHCVAEEMSGALANVVTSLRLLELEDGTPQSRKLLGLASRAATEQQALIHKVLAVFSEELNTLYSQNGSDTEGDLSLATERAMEATAPSFAEKNVRLISPWARNQPIRVSLDSTHLEHVIRNLLENALERTASGGEVDLSFDEQDDAVVLRVDDGGTIVPEDSCEDLFSKRALTDPATTASALRLHFCRMTLDSCGGEIGCATRDGEGNRFWIRLPKA